MHAFAAGQAAAARNLQNTASSGVLAEANASAPLLSVDRMFTRGLVNGRLWRVSSVVSKEALLLGIREGIVDLANASMPPEGSILAVAQNLYPQPGTAAAQNLVVAINDFYMNESYDAIPITWALAYVAAKGRGMPREDLEKVMVQFWHDVSPQIPRETGPK